MDNIETEVQVAEKVSRKKAAADKPTDGLSGERLKVKFHRNPDAGGSSNGAYFSLNGVAYGYKFDEEVEVPVEVLTIADNAVMDKFSMGADGKLTSQRVTRFPYSVAR